MEKLKRIIEGGCSCGVVRYKVLAKPLITHCCHCLICQTQTGSAFAINALLEAMHLSLVSGKVELINAENNC